MNKGVLLMLLAGGLGLAYLIYDWMQYRMRRRRTREVQESGLAAKVSYDWKVYMMIALAALLAFLYGRNIPRQVGPVVDNVWIDTHAYLVAVYVLFVGIWWAIRQARKEARSQRALVGEQVVELVAAFKSVFRIRPTVFSALEEANKKIPAPTGSAVAHAVTTFYVTSLPRRALDELRERIQDPYMEQFIYILERGEDSRHEDIMTALEGLLHRVKRAKEVRDKSEVSMTVINGQTRIIQLISLAIVIVVGAFPLLRQAYEGVPGQLVFVFFASLGVATSWYIDSQAAKLKEKVL